MVIIKSYKDLIVWQKTIILVEEVFKLTKRFPRLESHSLIDQMHRAVIAIASNIAEGTGRGSKKELCRFYSIAYGSALELETQLIISQKLNFAPNEAFKPCFDLLEEISKMLRTMIYKLVPRT